MFDSPVTGGLMRYYKRLRNTPRYCCFATHTREVCGSSPQVSTNPTKQASWGPLYLFDNLGRNEFNLRQGYGYRQSACDAGLPVEGISIEQAMDRVYNSEVFAKLCDRETGPYRESSAYVLSLLKDELANGKLIQLEE